MALGEREYHLETWKLRRRLDFIDTLNPGPNTSVFSVLIRPDDQITKIRAMLNDELSKSTYIKSNQNRMSVQEGLKAIGEHLKAYRFIPKNGLACYYGSVVVSPNSDKDFRLKMYFQPPKVIPRFMYNCGTSFDTTTLRSFLHDDSAVGYIVIDGKGALFANVRGNSKDVILKMSVNLPRKHTRGGQSAARFARIREDARRTYLCQVCEKATKVFISDNVPNVTHVVIAGQAQFKDHLEKSAHFDPRLKPIICLVITVDYGGEAGLNEAIKQSSAEIKNLRLGHEIKYISTFLEHLHTGNDSMVAYGIENVMQALEEGAVDILLAWQDLAVERWQLRHPDGSTSVAYLLPGQQPEQLATLHVEDTCALIDWLAENTGSFGSKLELLSNKSTEGTMLVQGFQGLVALLRYSRVQPEETEVCGPEVDEEDILQGIF